MSKVKQKDANTSKYEWILLAKAYLSLARIGLCELGEKRYIKQPSFEYDLVYRNNRLVIPILWNLKHSIELVVKSLGIIIDKQYLNTHDLATLSADLKSKFKNIEISKQEKIGELANLILKYNKCEFWNKKLSVALRFLIFKMIFFDIRIIQRISQ